MNAGFRHKLRAGLYTVRATSLLCLVSVTLAACQCGGPATKPKDRGEPCETDAECTSILCAKLPDATTRTCAQKCADGCAANEVCASLELGKHACVPEREGLCKPCQTSADCPYPADECLAIGAAKFCGRDCSFDSKCPSGFRCEMGFDLQGNQVGVQCQPTSNSCGCTPNNLGQTVPCEKSNPFGLCIGVQTCEQTGFSMCGAAVPAKETCNGLDDDCDMLKDEDLGQTTCGVGECQRITANCIEGVLQTCVQGDAGLEVCNEKDDDCDGTVDDGFNKQISITNCGQCGNVCAAPNGTPSCTNGVCGVGSCTAPFANCNTMASDGCETNTDTSLQHCGGCGAGCGGPGSTGSCAAGTCTLQCQPGFVNLDGNTANGCEYACTVTSTTDFPDLAFVDSNCDGLDGEAANSIFVSAAGNDANPGTRQQPKATIQAGLTAATFQGKRDVLVSQGNYATQVSMPSNVGLYGGFAAGIWGRSTANVVNVNSPLLIENVGNVTVQLMTFNGTTPAGSSATAYGAVIRVATNVTLEGVQIRAGNGTAGTGGAVGSTGGAGSNGLVGNPGCENSGGFCSGCSQPGGGFGGTSACGRTGGRGGFAANGGTTGGVGGTAVGGTLGGSGVPPRLGNVFNLGAPYVGGAGAAGAPGTAGISAGGVGTLSSFGYVVALASGGFAGFDGNGGGGGGGGGGGDNSCNSYGGGGGGGGAGGCGGGGGLRGFSGGASIGIFLYASTVTANGVTVTTGNGGAGGNGGSGGGGGLAGNGGVASNGSGNEYGGSGEQDDGSNGAKGGRGGNGGSGGAGGAGGGGPVLAVVRAGGSTWTADAATTYALGIAGGGGSSAAGAGGVGLSQAVY